MKQIYKSIARTVFSLYIGLVGGNAAIHGYEAWNAQRESQKIHYGENLSQQWKDYSASHLERLANARILVPLSSLDSPDRPLQVRRVDPEVDGIQLKFDVGRE